MLQQHMMTIDKGNSTSREIVYDVSSCQYRRFDLTLGPPTCVLCGKHAYGWQATPCYSFHTAATEGIVQPNEAKVLLRRNEGETRFDQMGNEDIWERLRQESGLDAVKRKQER